MKPALFAIAFGSLSTLVFFVLRDGWKLLPSGWLNSLLANTDLCQGIGVFATFTVLAYSLDRKGEQ